MSNTKNLTLSSAFKNKSLIHLSHLSAHEIIHVFDEAKKLQKEALDQSATNPKSFAFRGHAALLFFENSTRTRLSFEAACYKVGLGPLLIDAQSGSSLSKGETWEDTVLNAAALDPQVIIIRCGDKLDMEAMAKEIQMPIINAGWGAKGHPTQALLDLFTIWKERDLKNTKLLIAGDILHSRVASSHFEIFSNLGIEIAGCGPRSFKPIVKQSESKSDFANKLNSDLKWFDSIEEGLSWCDVVMALRVQLERHSTNFEMSDYHQKFGINKERLKFLKPDGLLMHPGPVNWGMELAQEVQRDPRTRILRQVNNGVFVRTALLKLILSGVE